MERYREMEKEIMASNCSVTPTSAIQVNETAEVPLILCNATRILGGKYLYMKHICDKISAKYFW